MKAFRNLLFTLVLSLATAAQALTPVHFDIKDATGAGLNVPITITSLPKIQGAGGSILAYLPVKVQLTNGLADTNLYSGFYNISVQGVPKGFSIYIEDTTNTVNAAERLLNGISYLSATNLNATIYLIASNIVSLPGAANGKFLVYSNGFAVWQSGSGFFTNQPIAVTGDVSGSGATNIALTLPSIVTGATKAKITFNAKGQVTAGADLAAGDIPDLTATYATPAGVTAATNTLNSRLITYVGASTNANAQNLIATVNNASNVNATAIGTKLTASTNASAVDTNTPLLLTAPLHYTNFLYLQSPIVVNGAPAGYTALNGTYVLSWTNATGGGGLPQAVWTNTANTNIIYLRDQGANITAWGIDVAFEGKTNDPNWFYLALADNTNSIPLSGSVQPSFLNAALSGTTLNVSATPNNVINTIYSGRMTNMLFQSGISLTNGVTVDPVIGNDAFALVNKYNVPFRTVLAASTVMTNGDHLFLNGYYDETGQGITFPNGVTIHGNNSTVASALTFTDGNSVYNLNTRYGGTHFNSTNQNQTIQVRGCNFYGEASGDGIDIDSWKGTLDFYNCFMGSGWDACIIDDISGLSTTNGIIRFNNCVMEINRTNGVPATISSGSHGINWFVSSRGGKVILNGGSYSDLNPTNLVFTSSDGQGNAAVLLSYKFGQSSFGTASLELNGPVIQYGTTNAGVLVTGISNRVGMPIIGSYFDNKLGASLTAPLISSTITNFTTARFQGGLLTVGETNASLTANRAMVTGSNKEHVSSATTDTEIGYLSGVTSAIQTQLNANASTNAPTLFSPVIVNSTVVTNPTTTASITLTNGTIALTNVNAFCILGSNSFNFNGITLTNNGLNDYRFYVGGFPFLSLGSTGTGLRNTAGAFVFNASSRALQNGDFTIDAGHFIVSQVGKGFQIKEGSNAKMGTSTMNGTTAVVVANTSVAATSRIFLTTQVAGGTVGTQYVDTRSAGTSFSIKSTSASDTSTVAWVIIDPAP